MININISNNLFQSPFYVHSLAVVVHYKLTWRTILCFLSVLLELKIPKCAPISTRCFSPVSCMPIFQEPGPLIAWTFWFPLSTATNSPLHVNTDQHIGLRFGLRFGGRHSLSGDE